MIRKLIMARKNTYKELNLIDNSFRTIYMVKVNAACINPNPNIRTKDTFNIAAFSNYNDALKCISITIKNYMKEMNRGNKFRILFDNELPKDKAADRNNLIEYARVIKLQGLLNESESALFTFEIEKLPYSNLSANMMNNHIISSISE